ncbi:LPS export ABC transporter permease LptF [Wohlfahrtiimonas chitiniclastica]|uniref:Lipopolysaccharide export system permease protein LptF n=1 Tax=Wohlfahrtiimonas chitiniclastica TaxID=400946 RepID=A0AB35BVX8_9GAMM|nr:LPS export ABC transporter permease LptF [Wohlfahrtiimonas chitiniclastica]MBS7816315.1 LPS export ABC transporter permease LptF [Wohlfahrtiimonas chitiniclastica]MBS7821690.1 LPS export ABC transporter permease LptF [Wohlfahrtiimonas chitiniclastica]MBS7823952.1 LPS export ABC transporter permease LptF [Wohlfahrtiimonas chitiniclastica]MBS7829482.1 LPS export ABC transporter permease LptF [Wohlfahrtiimonas chitiniclastica]MBS7831449.1 LPS export ABC transporter permease LptF [Wohlfahrtiimo
MKILRHYISREILLTLSATLIVLLAILLVQRLALMLNEVMNGGISANVIFSMIGIQILRFVAELVPLSFLLASIVAFGRLYKDSEMTAMFALGMPLTNLYRVLFQLAVPFSIILLLLNFWVIPYFSQKHFAIQQQAREEAQLTVVKAGTFRELSRGKNIVYVREISENQQEIKDVFIKTLEDEGAYTITLAKTGHQIVDRETGVRFLVLENGKRYSFLKNGGIDVLDYQEITLRLDSSTQPVFPKLATYSTREIVDNLNRTDFNSEFNRRFASAISVLILAIMIPALAHSNPRQGRFGKLLSAIFIYVVYFNLLNVAQNWVRKGVTPSWLGMWWVHGVMLIVALVIAYRYSKRLA